MFKCYLARISECDIFIYFLVQHVILILFWPHIELKEEQLDIVTDPPHTKYTSLVRPLSQIKVFFYLNGSN